MQAMILAAGLGTRLKPLTDFTPKALIKIDGEPLLKRVITKLKRAGCTRIIINVHHLSGQIIQYLAVNNNFGLDVRISDESEKLLNTGGGIKKAEPLFNGQEPIIIHNVDILSNVDLKELYNEHLRTKADVTMLTSVRKTKRYLLIDKNSKLKGRIKIDNDGIESSVPATQVEQFNKVAFAGIHVFSPILFKEMRKKWNDAFSIIDFYLACTEQYDIRCCVNENLKLMDAGKIDTIGDAESFLKEIHSRNNGQTAH